MRFTEVRNASVVIHRDDDEEISVISHGDGRLRYAVHDLEYCLEGAFIKDFDNATDLVEFAAERDGIVIGGDLDAWATEHNHLGGLDRERVYVAGVGGGWVEAESWADVEASYLVIADGVLARTETMGRFGG